MSTGTQAELEERVGNGITWLAAHDPKGNFYAWWQAGLTPLSKLPNQTDEVKAAWVEWYKAKTTFDRLDRQLAAIEARSPSPTLPWAIGWKGENEGSVRP